MNKQSENVSNVLTAISIRPTQIRREILKIFYNVNFALSHADIVKKLAGAFDRVTIYRTLETFEKKKLIHKIIDDSGVTKFASHDVGGCDAHFLHHKSNHLHFKCLSCGNIYCMCSIALPDVTIPAGFLLKNLKLIAEGICNNCAGEK